jgi:hypothetical protein
MAITEWTSEGMNWSDLEHKPVSNYIEAIRLAMLERIYVTGTHHLTFTTAINLVDPWISGRPLTSTMAEAVDDIIDYWLGVSPSFSNGIFAIPSATPADLDGEKLSEWMSTGSNKNTLTWGESSILADIGDAQRYRVEDDQYFRKEWAKQVYEILNRLYIIPNRWDRGVDNSFTTGISYTLTENERGYYGKGATVAAAVLDWHSIPYDTGNPRMNRWGLGAYRYKWGSNGETLFRSTIEPELDLTNLYQATGATISRNERVGVELYNSDPNGSDTLVDNTLINGNSLSWEDEGIGPLGEIIHNATESTAVTTMSEWPDLSPNDLSDGAAAPSGFTDRTGWDVERNHGDDHMAFLYSFRDYNVPGGFAFLA